MKLSPNFTLSELTKSQTALRRGLVNDPNQEQIHYLYRIANEVLQPVRDHFGIPFSPSSGFRSVELNAALGGSRMSQHTAGQAVDFEVPGVDNAELAEWVKDNIEFDQLILECYNAADPQSGWVHCSISDSPRGDVLTYRAPTEHSEGFYTKGLDYAGKSDI